MRLVHMSFNQEATVAEILGSVQTQMQDIDDRTCPQEIGLDLVQQPHYLALHFAQEPCRKSVLVMECSNVTTESASIQLKFPKLSMSLEEADSVVRHFEHAVSQIMSLDVDMPVSRIDLCTPADLDKMQKVNGAPVVPLSTLIHKLVEENANQFPEALAVEGWDASLTYHELVTLSLKLAANLQGRGVTAETIVPMLFERSAWAVVAMLATLQAGGAVMAMETETPEQRLKQMLNKAGVTCSYMLCSPSQIGVCCSLGFQPILVTYPSLQELPVLLMPLNNTVLPENRAIIQHTSGSTGFQKAIDLTHQAYCTSAKAHGPALGIHRSSRVYQFSAFSFDVCLSEILTTLICGACICIPTTAARNDELAESITAIRATWMFMTNSLARIVDPSQVTTLQTVVCGGERVDKSVIAKWCRAVDFFEVWGPSETSVYASSVLVKDANHDPNNIGKPLGCRLWVVDSQDAHRLAPYGCVGELCIEGPTVARGYLNLPDKTAAAFQSNPPWLCDGQGTIYRSGDLARFTADGFRSSLGESTHKSNTTASGLSWVKLSTPSVAMLMCNLASWSTHNEVHTCRDLFLSLNSKQFRASTLARQ